MVYCFLRNANFAEANLQDAELAEANLVAANLTNADLFNADLSEAKLESADLSGADLSESHLSDADLSGIVFNAETKFAGATVGPLLIENNEQMHNILKSAYAGTQDSLPQINSEEDGE